MPKDSSKETTGQQIDPKDLAAQLRQPHGEFGQVVADNLNESNIHITQFTYDNMQIADGHRLLEIGFGNGKLMDLLLAKANDLFLAGIDFSETMVAAAKDYHASNINKGIVDIQLGSVAAIPYPDGHFDKICHINTLYFWEDPLACAKETLRVLKDGGSIYTGIRHKDQMEHFPFAQYGFTFYDDDKAIQLFKDAGFSEVAICKQKDPAFEWQGQMLQMDSVCVIATK
ncbi:MAG: class I SAM-dependent methyltransferase [Flavipsychrobacter sp.]